MQTLASPSRLSSASKSARSTEGKLPERSEGRTREPRKGTEKFWNGQIFPDIFLPYAKFSKKKHGSAETSE